jgi:RND family efflux transporter MFP subunit
VAETGMADMSDMGDTAAAGEAGGERQVLFYRNPMDPSITSPVPTTDEMGMDYVPVYADEAAGSMRQAATVTIEAAVVQNMNVRTAPVERRDIQRQIRTVGYLEYDQGKMVTVTTKYPGFIERVYVNYVGEPVHRGERLFEIYAPELVQTQQELLSAAAYAHRLGQAPEDVRRRAEALLAAARQRLAYWDVSAEQVERIEAGGEVQRTLSVTAPASGLVMKRMPGLEGMAVKPGMELLHIADLSSLWLSVEVYEDQLQWLTAGARATITMPYFPGETFTGTVRFVEPQVSERTRTVGLRLEVPNPDGRLRAGMYATVVFEPVTAAGALVVPSLAVLRTGERNIVVVAEGGGRFTPRQVVLGPEGDHYVQVLAGVAEGERVVTSAQFLLDSESNIREAIQKLVAARRAARGGGDAQ